MTALSHDDFCRLSRCFNEAANLGISQDYRINEWLKECIASVSRDAPGTASIAVLDSEEEAAIVDRALTRLKAVPTSGDPETRAVIEQSRRLIFRLVISETAGALAAHSQAGPADGDMGRAKEIDDFATKIVGAFVNRLGIGAADEQELIDALSEGIATFHASPPDEVRRLREWQPIDTLPGGKIVLMWAATDVDATGVVKNWKMATGSIMHGTEDSWREPRLVDGRLGIEWDGRYLHSYDVLPTHWMLLPPSPALAQKGG